MGARLLTGIGATILPVCALGVVWSTTGWAALTPLAAEFMIRDCIARFGDPRVRVCEMVAESGTRPGINPTIAACLAVTDRHGIGRGIAREICGYYYQKK
jgi:hypothetical protein